MYSPPFREISEKEDKEIIHRINDSKPDFVWVALGAPKQEIWMAEHKNKVHALMIGVHGKTAFLWNVFLPVNLQIDITGLYRSLENILNMPVLF